MIALKIKPIAGWLVLFGLLTAFLQHYYAFHFFYIEQSQLFLCTTDYLFERLAQPGGFTLWLAEALVQFFVHPFVGAIATSALLTGIGIATQRLIRRVGPKKIGRASVRGRVSAMVWISVVVGSLTKNDTNDRF